MFRRSEYDDMGRVLKEYCALFHNKLMPLLIIQDNLILLSYYYWYLTTFCANLSSSNTGDEKLAPSGMAAVTRTCVGFVRIIPILSSEAPRSASSYRSVSQHNYSS